MKLLFPSNILLGELQRNKINHWQLCCGLQQYNIAMLWFTTV